jgi:thioredoxin 1
MLGAKKGVDNPYENMPEAMEATKRPVATAGSKAARLGIIASVVGIGLNLAGVTVLKEQSILLTMAAFAYMAVVWGGVLAAVTGLFRGWRNGGKDVMILATVGLLLNGALLAMFFGKLPVRGRVGAGRERYSVRETGAQPVSGQSGRRIVTEDWTAGFVVELTDNNFDRIVGGSRIPVLVDFWAPRCGPCKRMTPIIEQLADDYEGKVKVCKLNVDNAGETAARFKIRGIPTIILFERGNVRKKWVGTTDRAAICLEINKLLDE